MWKRQSLISQVSPQRRWSSHVFVLFFVFSLLFFSLNAQAGEVTLAWDPPSTEYEGFILSYGTSSESFSNNQDVGPSTTHTVNNLNEGQTYFFAVKAYNANHANESPFSNQVNVTIPVLDTTPPASPISVQIVSGP